MTNSTTREAAIQAANQEFRALLDRCDYLAAEEVVDAAAEIYPRHLTGGEEAAVNRNLEAAALLRGAVQAVGFFDAKWMQKALSVARALEAPRSLLVQASGESRQELRATIERLDKLHAAAIGAEYGPPMNLPMRRFGEFAFDHWPAIAAHIRAVAQRESTTGQAWFHEKVAQLSAELAKAKRLASTLFAAVAHGDDEHREWLQTAIDDHFAGKPTEPVKGKGTAEAITHWQQRATLAEARVKELEGERPKVD
jgi:hypothetical protein